MVPFLARSGKHPKTEDPIPINRATPGIKKAAFACGPFNMEAIRYSVADFLMATL
ncbi:hypothetical protein GWC95_01870 [Sediminibacterium roseum]|uniref:Uncharacterized protein n=1 Tax=Sediminibacterium roseum TaxID=1978412 RepID=A0ABW9ZTW3_9BACT|nr:hypothetical protein [Sediminibacterium roseum]NCI48653.1 hypothetical protein [Sediminibacterium roseum]